MQDACDRCEATGERLFVTPEDIHLCRWCLEDFRTKARQYANA